MNKTANTVLFVASMLLFGDLHPAMGAPNDAPNEGFSWAAPEGCPTEEEARGRVSSHLPPSTPLVANARIDKVANRYRLVLDVPSKGERVLESSTCEELVASMAVVLAMSASQPPQADPRSEGDPSAPAVREESHEHEQGRPPLEAQSASSRWRVRLRGQAALDFGTAPRAALGGGAALGVELFANVHAEATTNIYAAQTGTLAADASRGATFRLASVGARACWILLHNPDLGPCLGVDVSVLAARGFGSDVTRRATSITWAPEASGVLKIRLFSHIYVAAGAGVLAPTSTPSFRIVGSGDIHRASPVAFRGWLGPEVVF